LIALTKVQALKLKSVGNSAWDGIDGDLPAAAFGNAVTGESAFVAAMDDAHCLDGARFNFVFDCVGSEHMQSLSSNCTLRRGNWFPTIRVTAKQPTSSPMCS